MGQKNKLSKNDYGHAFEYSLLEAIYKILSKSEKIEIKKDSWYDRAKGCFFKLKKNERNDLLDSSKKAIKHLIELEPRLANALSANDKLTVSIQPDSEGQQGDVRDILTIRSQNNWEIGISAKHHHEAIKHSRLSGNIDFGDKWLGLKSSHQYFKDIKPIINKLYSLKKKKIKWDELAEKHDKIYHPMLVFFKNELSRLYKKYNNFVPEKMLQYLIGANDFYKVIYKNEIVKIQAFNFKRSLKKAAKKIKPKIKIKKTILPSKIIHIAFKENSKTTLLVFFDAGWQLSFRVHNASKFVEPSLKFDIQIIGQPPSLYTNHLI